MQGNLVREVHLPIYGQSKILVDIRIGGLVTGIHAEKIRELVPTTNSKAFSIGGKTSAGNRANPVYEPRLQVELSSGFVRSDFCVGSSHSENARSKEEGYLFHKGCGRP